jgi:hypothetical protein
MACCFVLVSQGDWRGERIKKYVVGEPVVLDAINVFDRH